MHPLLASSVAKARDRIEKAGDDDAARRAKFLALDASIQSIHRRKGILAEALAARGKPVKMRAKWGGSALAHGNVVQGERPFRLTYIDRDGIPTGHTEHDTLERAIKDGFGQGYKRIKKAIIGGKPGRAARRAAVASALQRTKETGLEHGFHHGTGGTDKQVRSGTDRSLSYPTPQKIAGGDFHHTHRKWTGHRTDTLSPGDLGFVMSAAGGKRTLWMHDAATGSHEAARISPKAAKMPVASRMQAFEAARRATAPPKDSTEREFEHGRALRTKLKSMGLIVSGRSKGRTG